MSLYEALYGRKCRTPLNWSQTGDSRIFGTDLMMGAEKQVKEIQDRLKLSKSRQKSYYDAKHRQMSFEPGEHVYLRVTPITTKKYTSVMIRVCHSRSRFLSCMYIHEDFMTESR